MAEVAPTAAARINALAERLSGIELNTLADLRARGDPALAAAAAAGADDLADCVVGRAVDAAYADWVALFAGYSAEDGKRLAKEGREKADGENRSLTYGEVRTFG